MKVLTHVAANVFLEGKDVAGASRSLEITFVSNITQEHKIFPIPWTHFGELCFCVFEKILDFETDFDIPFPTHGACVGSFTAL